MFIKLQFFLYKSFFLIPRFFSRNLDGIINDCFILNYLIFQERDCQIRTIDSMMTNAGYGIAMTKGSPHKKTLSALIRKYRGEGWFSELMSKWFKNNCKSALDSSVPGQIGVAQFGGLYVILCGAVIFAVFIFFLEVLAHRKRKSYVFTRRRIDRI